MKRKNISLMLTLVCFLLLFSLPGYGLSKSNKNIETYANPGIDYNSYRYFTFLTDTISVDYLQHKSFQSSIIELLEEKNYIYVEDIKEADFVMILYSSILYEESLVQVPIYVPGKKINSSHLINGAHHVHGPVRTPDSWEIETELKGRYYPFIGISCIGNLPNAPELIWQGQGVKSTNKSNLDKYGKELIKEIFAKFPEITEKVPEELPSVEIKEDENIKMLLEQLKNS